MNKINLKPPVTYQGAKTRIAKNIINIINPNHRNKFFDVCSGGGSISIELINRGFMSENIFMIDKSMWGLFYSEIGSGSFCVDEMKKEFSKIPKNKNKIKSYVDNLSNNVIFDNHTIMFLLFQASSFGGKSVDIINNKVIHSGFRDIWISEDRKRCVNPMMPMPETIIKRVSLLIKYASGVNSFYGDANEFHFEKYISNGDIVFIDPPYMNTQKYIHDFNYIDFVKKILTTKKDFQLWITDYKAHSKEHYILSATNKGGISGNTNKKRTEILSRIK